ncbi:hypothetical protein HMI55_003260 [Coelomomyces lativittatus]|nr:hypothetical protein HMI55_003260 [Coelomomyces lativittatus]
MRVDAVRYLYLHAYGGIYADLDMEALKPLDAMIQAPIVLGWLTHANHGHALPNAFMAASEPGHPFWLLLLAKSIENQWLYAGVEQVTGPHMLTEMVLHYVDQCKKVTSISSTFQTKKNEQTTPPSTTKMMMMENKEVNRDEIQFVGDLQLLPTGMIYPYSWIHPGNHHSVCSATSHEFNATECKARFPNAFTITYWTHSWGHKNILLQD